MWEAGIMHLISSALSTLESQIMEAIWEVSTTLSLAHLSTVLGCRGGPWRGWEGVQRIALDHWGAKLQRCKGSNRLGGNKDEFQQLLDGNYVQA